jgi:hypothetical protein
MSFFIPYILNHVLLKNNPYILKIRILKYYKKQYTLLFIFNINNLFIYIIKKYKE